MCTNKYSLTHSLTYLLTYSLTHILTHSLTYSLTHSCIFPRSFPDVLTHTGTLVASDNSAGNSSWSSDQQIFQLVVDNNIEVVRKMLDSDNRIVNKIDDKGNPSLTHSLTYSLGGD